MKQKIRAFSAVEIILVIAVLAIGALVAFYVLNSDEEPETTPEEMPVFEETLKVIVLGDSGTGEADQKAIADQIELLDYDLVLHTGDVAYDDGTAEEIVNNHENVYSEKFRSNFYPSIGNHDNRTTHATPYLAYFDLPEVALNPDDHERYYSFDVESVHFISLDTNDGLEEISDESDTDMADWLEQDLKSTKPSDTVVAFFHHPAFNAGKHGDTPKVKEHLVPLFEEYDVDLVLSGHDHNYQRTCALLLIGDTPTCDAAGIAYVLTGGGGRALYDFKSDPDYFESLVKDFNFVYLEIGESQISLQAINRDGIVIDSAEISL